MSQFEAKTESSIESLDDRAVRALTEYITVLDGDGGIFTVIGENENGSYRVDAIEGRCTCADSRYNLDADEACKHQHRVAFATARREVPSWVDESSIAGDLGAFVDDVPTPAASNQTAKVATDGGETTEEEKDEEGEEEDEEEEEEEVTGLDTPQRSESADFGLGESTGVQEL